MTASSSSEKTPSSGLDSKETQNTSLTLGSDFPGLACLRDYNSAMDELSQIKTADPAYIQAMEVFYRTTMQTPTPTPSIQRSYLSLLRQKQLSDAMLQLSQCSRRHLLQNPHISQAMDNFGNPEALEQFTDSLNQIGKDNSEFRYLLSEIDTRGPAALVRYWDDKDELKKLGKLMGTTTEKDDEQVIQGMKALQILCGYVKMKAESLIWKAKHKKKNKPGKKKKRATALQNVESKTPLDVATTSSI